MCGGGRENREVELCGDTPSHLMISLVINQTCRVDACLQGGLGHRLRKEKAHPNLFISLQN